jgi:hypothetical protein
MTDDAEYRARVLQVQYRNIEGNHLSNFRRGYSSGRMAANASAALIYPYAKVYQDS